MPNLPEYRSRTSYRNPGNGPSAETFFQFANNTDLSFFEWIRTQPRILSSFDSYHASSIATERTRTGKGFSDIYSFEDLGWHLSFPDQAMLVDVGGGYGQVLEDIQKHLPGLVGKMVLEDLPETFEAHVPLENVEIVPYNFITMEQPVKGARAYLLRHVLHDWPDHSCRQILLKTIPALIQGESRILVVEKVLPPLNAPVLSSLLDIQMMQYGGCERKEKQWRGLFDSVGLEVVKIWPGLENDSMMEITLKSG